MTLHTSRTNQTIAPAPWICFRTYRRPGDESRAVITSERDHFFAIFTGTSADLWSHVEKGCTHKQLIETFATLDEAEISDFINLLEQNGIVAPSDTHEKTRARKAPTPKRLEFAENTSAEMEMMDWAARHGFLYSLQWEMTFRCNERCTHCYNPGAAHFPREKPRRTRYELSTAEANRTLQDLAKMGVFRLILSGGEVTLREDFWEIVAFARSLGFSLALYTNGQRITPEFAEKLADHWPTSVSISVYSADADLHDEVTNLPGSYDKSITALKLLHDLGIKTYIKSTQMRHTVYGYRQIDDLADELGAGAEIDMHITDGADGSRIAASLSVKDPRQLVMMALTPGSPLWVGTDEQNYGYREKDRNASVCGAGITFMYMDPEGNISPCGSLPVFTGSQRTDGIFKIWGQSDIGSSRRKSSVSIDALSSWQRIKLSDYKECGTHKRCGWCNKCPGLAFLEHGDVLGPSTVNCRNAAARMIAANLLKQGLSVPEAGALLEISTEFGCNARPEQSTDYGRESSLLPIDGDRGQLSSEMCGLVSISGVSPPHGQGWRAYRSRLEGLELKNGTDTLRDALSKFDDLWSIIQSQRALEMSTCESVHDCKARS